MSDVNKARTQQEQNNANLNWLSQLPEEAWQHRYFCKCGGGVEFQRYFEEKCTCIKEMA